jgi:general secretion pathway protein K
MIVAPRSGGRRSQRGVALIVALLIVSLAIVISSDAVWEHQVDQRRAAAMLWGDQAYLYALGAEAWAGRILVEDARDSDVDHPGEIWATDLPPLPIEGGTVDGALVDLQGRFNINNLVDGNGATDPDAVAQFERLLDALALERRWASLAADWLDGDIDPNFPDGAEDSTYMGIDPPYRSANLPVTSVTELMSLPEMDAVTFDRLRPHVVALPRGTTININTATGPVIQSLTEGLTEGDALGVLQSRPDGGYEDLAELDTVLPADALLNVGTTSRYFRLIVRVNVGTADLTMYSLLDREGPESIRPLLRTFGTD